MSIFEERRLKKRNFYKFYKEKWQKIKKKFGLSFDSGLKLM